MAGLASEKLLHEALGEKFDKGIDLLNFQGEKALKNEGDRSDDIEIPNVRHWKELGQYFDTLQPTPVNTTTNGIEVGMDRPLDQPMKYRICNLCGNPILESVIADHITDCKHRQERNKLNQAKNSNEAIELNEDSGISDSNSKRPNSSSTGYNTPNNNGNKKRKNETTISTATTSVEPEMKKSKKERKKKETKPKVTKNKGPVDVEKQCGVPLPNGGFCARSLTCKTHSMGAKRAVLGRSAPYDQLLAAYQKKNQAKIGAAAAAAQQAKEELEHSAHVALDDEEETQQVLEGVKKSIPFPLERRVIMPIRYRTKYLRMREMFASSILPRLTNNPLGALQGRAAVMNIEAINDQNVFPVRSQHQKNAQQKALLRAQQMQQAKLNAANGGTGTPMNSSSNTSIVGLNNGSPNQMNGNMRGNGTSQQLQQNQMAQMAKAKALQAQMQQLRVNQQQQQQQQQQQANQMQNNNPNDGGFNNINMASLTNTQRHLLILEQQKRLQNYRG